MAEPRWDRAQRLDAEWAVVAVRNQIGVPLVVEGPCPGGQVGAAYVRWPDGHRSVLTWQPGRRAHELEARQLPTVEALRRTGYPAPAIELLVELDRAVVLVQELLPGQKVERVGAAILTQALALNDRQAHVLAGRDVVPLIGLHLVEDGPGFCLHEPLRRHSARSRALERWIRDVARDHGDALPGDDAVHMDFQPDNLLATGDVLTGVVDWDGAGRGDRRLDLVTLRFGLGRDRADPAVMARLDRLLDELPAKVLRPAWAHMSLRMVDWAIRHFAPADVDEWIDLAWQRMR